MGSENECDSPTTDDPPSAPPSGDAGGEEGKAIPFITLSFAADGKAQFAVTEEARAMLADISGPLSVISVVGMYRTGKSFLLNRILLGQTGGFPVGNTVNACTKGLWIWSKPLRAKAADGTPVNLLVIDTEGLGSLDASTQHDCSIFALALLVSSFFIYNRHPPQPPASRNSVGSISESAVENLSLVVNLTKFIRVSEADGGEEDGSQFASHFRTLSRSFLWVVRDFSLLLVDEKGRDISSKYLDTALREIKGFSDKVVGKNRIRSMIRAFFQDRECFPLVRPVEDESLLQDLCNQGEEVLRPEFAVQMKALRARVFSSANPKLIHGAQLSGPMLFSLAESYVGAVNDGQVPSIKDAWSSVCETECRKQVSANP
ncbi:guanylate-binding protein [Baffinella frigidus]|nr:guanylate-binding protein [Cryptophyta sp. CCMP2293]